MYLELATDAGCQACKLSSQEIWWPHGLWKDIRAEVSKSGRLCLSLFKCVYCIISLDTIIEQTFLHEEGKCTKEKDMSNIINENSN